MMNYDQIKSIQIACIIYFIQFVHCPVKMQEEFSSHQVLQVSESQGIDSVVQAIAQIMNQDFQIEGNISVFLTKIFKNNVSNKNKKMKSIRLSRFGLLLKKISQQFPTDKNTVQILYQCIYSMLFNRKNFQDQEDQQIIYGVGIQIAKIIQETSRSQFFSHSSNMLDYLLYNKKPIIMETKKFEQLLKTSTFFKRICIDDDQFQESQFDLILEEIKIQSIILEKLKFQKVYPLLFQKLQDKKYVTRAFYDHSQKLPSKNHNKIKTFKQCFLKNPLTNIRQIEAILSIVNSQMFDCINSQEIIKNIVKEKLSLDILCSVNLKQTPEIEDIYVQSLAQQAKNKSINQLIKLFIQSSNNNNYFLLYLIFKSQNNKISSQYLELIFQENSFTNRKAIIFCLSVLDNIGSFFLLLRRYCQLDYKFKTEEFNSRFLKVIHFSLQNTSKSIVFSNILKFVQSSLLNDKSNLGFIVYQTLKSQELNLQTKRMVNQLLKQKLIENDQIYKMKIDLQSLSGNNQPLVQNLKQINKIFQKPLEDIIKLLPTLEDVLLQPVLMGINNKFGVFFSQDQFNNTLDWTLKIYKKYLMEFGNQLKDFLVQKNKAKEFTFIKTLIQFNMQRKNGLNFDKVQKDVFDADLIQIINFSSDSFEKAELYQNSRLKKLDFNDFYLMHSKSRNLQTKKGKILWLKTILIQLKSLVKNLVSGQKIGNRKQIKIISATDVEYVHALKIIHEYFSLQIDAKDILKQVFSILKPQHQFFDMIQKLAGAINQQFYPLQQKLSDLLTQINCEAIDFLVKLLQSKVTEDKKKKKKKNQKDHHDQNTKYLQVVENNISSLFGDPNMLQSYENMFSILKKCVQKIESSVITFQINNFLSQVKYFSSNNYEEWKKKILSLVKLWTIINKLVQKNLQITVIQKHFNMFTDCLNKLYEQFRSKQDFLEVQEKILKALLLIYSKQQFTVMEQEKNIPDLVIKNIFEKFSLKTSNQNTFFMCNTCKKSVCHICATLVHRPHDKTYTGKEGTCVHDGNQQKKSKKTNQQAPLMKMPGQSFFRKQDDSALIIPRHRFDQRQRQDQLRLQQEQLAYLIAQKNRLGRENSASIKQMFENRYYTFARGRMARDGDRQRDNRERERQEKRSSPKKKTDFMKFIMESKENQIQDDQQQISDIKSQSEKQFCLNETYIDTVDKSKSRMSPEFCLQQNKIMIPIPKIKMIPLSNLFIRELNSGTISHNQKDKALKIQTQSRLTSVNQKYTFFRCTHYKDQNRQTYRQRGGYGGYNYGGGYGNNPVNTNRRNVLCVNKKNIFYPSSLALISLNFPKLRTRFEFREQNKLYGQNQQQKLYSPIPNNINYEIVQFQMSRSNSHPIIALLGVNQLTFYPINSQGRFSKIVNPEFNRSQNITKFIWVDGKNVFAIAYSNYIRIGALTANNHNIKNIAKIHINKQIRDFDVIVSAKIIILFIVDTEGNLYKIQEDVKQLKNISVNAQQKKVVLNIFSNKRQNKKGNNLGQFFDNEQSSSSYAANMLQPNLAQKTQSKIEQIYSIKFLSKQKLLVNTVNGDLNIIDVKRKTLKLQATSFNLKKILSTNSNLQIAFLMESIKLMRRNQTQNQFTFGCILRKLNPFENTKTRKHIGFLSIMSLKLNENNLQLLTNNQQNTESFDFTPLNDTSCMVVYINDDGLMTMFRYHITSASKRSKQDINIQINDDLVNQMNPKFKQQKILDKITNFSTIKAVDFKENRDISNVNKFEFNINVSPGLVKISPYNAVRNFVTGFSMIIQSSTLAELQEQRQKLKKTWQKQSQIEFNVLNNLYKFTISSSTNLNSVTSATRQIQISFSLKETMELFINHSNTIQFIYKTLGKPCVVKSIRIFGIQRESHSTYLKAYLQLVKTYKIYREQKQKKPQILLINNIQHKQKDSKCVQYYLNNQIRTDINNVPIDQFQNFFQKHKYNQEQSNFLLKLQLFAQTISQYLQNKNQKEIQQFIQSTRNLLLQNQQYHKRKSIQSTILKIINIACRIYCQRYQITSGHPYQFFTLITCYFFQKRYNQWKSRKSLSTFKSLLKTLSKLIYRRTVNLYLIFQIYPQLILDISLYFHSLINDQRMLQEENSEQYENLLTKSNVCSMYISVVCEYYQLLKNKNVQNSQQKILILLQKVFELMSKKQFNKQIFMNPFVYIQNLYCQAEKVQVQCAVKLFNLKNIDFSLNNFLDIQSSFEKTNIKRQNNKESLDNALQIQGMRQDQNGGEQNLQELSYGDQPEQQEKNMEEEQKEMEMYLQMEADDWDNEDMQIIKHQQKQIQLRNSIIRQRNGRSNRQSRNVNERQFFQNPSRSNNQAVQMQVQQNSNQDKNQLKKQMSQSENYRSQSESEIAKILLSRLKSPQQTKKLTTMNYYQFSLEIATTLFKRVNYLNKSNIVFYMGLLFNLLRIIQQNLQFQRTSKNINKFIIEVDNAFEKSENSALFLILSCFVQCQYQKRSNIDKIQMAMSKGKLCAKFLQYYESNPLRFKYLLQKYQPKFIHPRVSISDVLKFKDFQIKNQQYNLKFIANIYLNLRLKSINVQTSQNIFKICDMELLKWNMLFNVVKYNTTIHKNIMYFQHWEKHQDRAKILVGFQKLHYDRDNGVQLLLSCSKLTPLIYVQELNQDQNKIRYLEHLLVNQDCIEDQINISGLDHMSSGLKQKIMNLLNVYYQN